MVYLRNERREFNLKIGKLIDDMFELREKLRKIDDDRKKLNLQMKDLSDQILTLLETEGVTKASGEKATAFIKVGTYFKVNDKKSFILWCVNNDRFDFIRGSVNSAPAAEMLERLNTLPSGTESYTQARLNLRRI